MQSQDTQTPALLNTLAALLEQFAPAFDQRRVYDRAASLVFGCLFAFARKTMTQLICGLGVTGDDWTAFYRLLSRGRFRPQVLSEILLGCVLEYVPSEKPFTAVIDATHVRRTSLKMPGTGWGRAPGTAPWARGFARLQRFENICWLTPGEDGYRRALPLRWIHAPTPKAIESEDAPIREWEAGLAGVQWLRQQLDRCGRPDQTLLVAADGGYDVNDLWKALPERTVLICRCAKNRRLFQLPPKDEPVRRGRARKYGDRSPSPEQMRHDGRRWRDLAIRVRGQLIYIRIRQVGPFLVERSPDRPVFLLLVRGYHKKGARIGMRREPCQYLVNAVKDGEQWRLPLPLAELVEMTWHRWEIEVCHREIKTSFGLGQMQCWSKRGSVASVQFMAWAYSVLVLAGYKAWGGLLHGPAFETGWQHRRRRWSVTSLLQSYRAEMWQQSQIKATYPVIRAKQPVNRPWVQGLTNAVLSSSRG